MRPIFFGATLNPPEMTICFPGRPVLLAMIKIKALVTTQHEAELAAVRELNAMTPRDLELLREIAKPVAAAVSTEVPEPPVLAGMVQRVLQEPRYDGPIHCPGCGYSIGKGSAPSIGYVRTCPTCRGSINVEFHERSIVVTFLSDE